MKMLKSRLELPFAFSAGGLVYAGIEIVFRGFTHWSMIIVGGLCCVGLYIISLTREKLWKKWVMGAAVILTLEFVAGIILNIVLRWNVWDYSIYRFNLYGQICARFALCWLALCIPANALCAMAHKKLFGKTAGA